MVPLDSSKCSAQRRWCSSCQSPRVTVSIAMKKSMTSEYSQQSAVIWESSVLTPRSTPTPKSKSRLFTSSSLRILKDFPLTEASEERYPLLKHLYSPLTHRNRQQRETGEVFYSVKYVGVCNGEMGVLSQRKQLQFARKQRPFLPSTSPLLSGSLENTSGLEVLSGTKDPIPQEFLYPNPERYAEYLVHTYTHPRPLTASSVRKLEKADTFTTLDPGRFNRALHDLKPAKISRSSISGWKLTTPKPHRAKPAPAVIQPVRTPAPQSPLLLSIQKGGRQRNEAYLQYLRLQGHLK